MSEATDDDPALKIKPPPPITSRNPSRIVDVPPTVGEADTTAGDDIPLNKTRADFREDEFTRVIRQHGKHIIWRKALICPCFNPSTEQAMLDCEDCNASGYLYVQPITITAWMAQFDAKVRLFEKFGSWQSGQVSVSVEAKHRPGYRDSLEMRDSVIPFAELIFKGNRRGLRSALPDGVDSARFRIVDVSAMLHKKKDGSLLFLQEGVHFEITYEGWIKWTAAGDRAVPDKGVVSLQYEYHPIFLVVSWFHITRDDTSGRKTATPRIISHPVQVMAQLDYLVNVNAVPSMTPGAVAQPTGVPNVDRKRA